MGKDLNELYRQIAAIGRQLAVERVVLFGSRARGDNRERSDIDLAVFGLPPSLASRFRQALEDLPTLLSFDLVCVDERTAPALLENISREGVTLYVTEM